MQAENSVPFKVCVERDEKSEIRYFSVDRNVESSYEYLYAKLQSTFPCLSGKTFTVMWIDLEGDKVNISSDEELIFALSSMPSLKKLHIMLDGNIEMEENINPCGSSRKRSSNIDTVHPNIICDACNGDVVGFRYKCLICADFDLCQICEAKNYHSEHHMIRIPVPIAHISCDIRGSPLGYWLNLNANKNSEHGENYGKKHCKERKTSEGRNNDDKRNKRFGRHSKKHYCEAKSDILKTFSAYINDFTNLAGDIKLDIDTSNTQTDKPNTEETAQSNRNKTILKIFNVFEKMLPEVEIVKISHSKPSEDSDNVPSTSGLAKDQTTTSDAENKNQNDKDLPTNESVKNEDNIQNVEIKPKEASVDDMLFSKNVISNQAVPESMLDSKSIDEYESSDDSDCIVIQSENSPVDKNNTYGWTILNSEESADTENQVDSVAPEQAKEAEKDMETIVQEFQKNMEVSDAEASPVENPINETDETTNNTEKRFILVENNSTPTTNVSCAFTQTNASNMPSSAPINSPFIPPFPILGIVPPVHIPLNNVPPPNFHAPVLTPPNFPPPNFPPPNAPTFSAGAHYQIPQPFVASSPFMPTPFTSSVSPAVHPLTHGGNAPYINSASDITNSGSSSFSSASSYSPNISSTLHPNISTSQTQTNFPQPTENLRNQQPRVSVAPPPSVTINSEPPRGIAPHVNATLQQLLNMGYTNQGGWLTQICEVHNGNINKVLDVLSSANGRN